MKIIASRIQQVELKNLSAHLLYLAQSPLPSRTLNYTRPGQTQCTLYEADDFIEAHLRYFGYSIKKEKVKVQAFQLDKSVAHGFRKPLPTEPWFDAFNLYAQKVGHSWPEELIIVVAHKDSQSWLTCAAGAHDNAIGTAGLLEIARLLSQYKSQRSIWFIFCNEEHWPWTSVAAAQTVVEAGLKVIAVLNLDGIAGKADSDKSHRRMLNVTRYSTPAGKILGDLIAHVNQKYKIGLIQTQYFCEQPNDDDGSFIKAGIEAAVLNIGSFPYAEPNYHTVADTPEKVDLVNARLTTQLMLATVLHLDFYGYQVE